MIFAVIKSLDSLAQIPTLFHITFVGVETVAIKYSLGNDNTKKVAYNSATDKKLLSDLSLLVVMIK